LKATCGKNKTADFTEKGLGVAMLCLLKPLTVRRREQSGRGIMPRFLPIASF